MVSEALWWVCGDDSCSCFHSQLPGERVDCRECTLSLDLEVVLSQAKILTPCSRIRFRLWDSRDKSGAKTMICKRVFSLVHQTVNEWGWAVTLQPMHTLPAVVSADIKVSFGAYTYRVKAGICDPVR